MVWAQTARHGQIRLLQTRQLSQKLQPQYVIGMRRETKNRWERRAPLTPSHVRKLTREGVQVLVQPSYMRVFTDHEYKAAGAVLTEDISVAKTILGVKEVPISQLERDKTYVCFSHTIKAQEYNMDMLDIILNRNIRLIDYEVMADSNGKRVIGFGRFAGIAGMIDLLRGFGDRLLGLGYTNPFLGMGYSDYYHSVAAARTAIQLVGHSILYSGTPQPVSPLIFAFTGEGNVTQGAQEIFEELPHEYIEFEDLQTVAKSGDSNLVYGLQLKREHLVQHKENPTAPFDKAHYTANPHEYEGRFHSDVAPYISALVNCMYWDQRFPRLLSNEQMKELHNGDSRLLAIADISADPYGSIEATRVCTTIDRPFLVHNPNTDAQLYNWEADGLLLGSVDNLPAELPIESSQHFGNLLLPYIKELARSDASTPLEDWDCSSTLKNAVITNQGKLTKRFEYIDDLRRENEAAAKKHKVLLLGSGMVAGSYVEHLRKLLPNKLSMTIVSGDLASAQEICQQSQDGCNVLHINIGEQPIEAQLADLVGQHDLVVSLLPATLHASIARLCIDRGTNMVTTSYVSPDMEALHDEAMAKGVTILNECGLDPGIDHFLAVDLFDRITSKGRKVVSFESWCGGLPSPHCVGTANPLQYKFSWSPRGVLTAAMNPARFLEDGAIKDVNPGELPRFVRNLNIGAFGLESTPNRDSLQYIDLYGLDRSHLRNMLRATLRFTGFWSCIDDLKYDDLLSTTPVSKEIVEADLSSSTRRLLERIRSNSGDRFVCHKGTAPCDALSSYLWKHLQYAGDDQDLVVMRHRIVSAAEDGSNKEGFVVDLMLAGDKVPAGVSAMARTVGAPAALASKYVLSGDHDVAAKGVLRPLDAGLARKFIKDLESWGICAVEQTFEAED